MSSYYFDTFALIEIAKANPKYLKYLRGVTVFTHKLNLMEFTYFLKRKNRDNEIYTKFLQLKKYHCEASDDSFINAAILKFKYKKRKLSYIDCLGYEIAKENSAKFLTGDEKFEDLPNVEFVK